MKFNDFNHIKEIEETEDIVAFLGIDYLQLLYELTKNLPQKKYIFYNSNNLTKLKAIVNNDSKFKFIKYETTQKINWYYKAAKRFMDGDLSYE